MAKLNDNRRARKQLAALDTALSRLDALESEGGLRLVAAQSTASVPLGQTVTFLTDDGKLRTGQVVGHRETTVLVKCAQFEAPVVVSDEQFQRAAALRNADFDHESVRADLADARSRSDLRVINESTRADGTYLGRVAFSKAKGVPTRDEVASVLGEDVQLHSFEVSAAGNSLDAVGLMVREAGPKEWLAGAGLALGLMGAPGSAAASPSYDPNNQNVYQQGMALDSKQQSELAALPAQMQKIRAPYARSGGAILQAFEQGAQLGQTVAPAQLEAEILKLVKSMGPRGLAAVDALFDGAEYGKLAKRQKELGQHAGASAPKAKSAQESNAREAMTREAGPMLPAQNEAIHKLLDQIKRADRGTFDNLIYGFQWPKTDKTAAKVVAQLQHILASATGNAPAAAPSAPAATPQVEFLRGLGIEAQQRRADAGGSLLAERLAADFTQAVQHNQLTVDQLESAIFHRAQASLHDAEAARAATHRALQIMRETFAGPDLNITAAKRAQQTTVGAPASAPAPAASAKTVSLAQVSRALSAGMEQHHPEAVAIGKEVVAASGGLPWIAKNNRPLWQRISRYVTQQAPQGARIGQPAGVAAQDPAGAQQVALGTARAAAKSDARWELTNNPTSHDYATAAACGVCGSRERLADGSCKGCEDRRKEVAERAEKQVTAARSDESEPRKRLDKHPKAEFERLEMFQRGSTVCIVAKMKNQQSVSDWGLRIQFRSWCERELQKLDGPVYSLLRGNIRLVIDRATNRCRAVVPIGSQRTGLPQKFDGDDGHGSLFGIE